MSFQFTPITSWEQFNIFFRSFSEYINSFGKITVDQYVGTGAQLEIFTRFQPKFIIIMQETNPADMVIWYGSFAPPNSYVVQNGAQLTTGILGINTRRDGFILGTHAFVNTNAILYKYVVIGT